MSALTLFNLAAKQTDWLVARQKAIATNVAHSDSPGYRAVDLKPFSEMLDKTGLSMTSTDAGHIGADKSISANLLVKDSPAWDVKYSGNTVSLDQQMVKANEVHTAYALNTSIVRSFHRMLLASVKG